MNKSSLPQRDFIRNLSIQPHKVSFYYSCLQGFRSSTRHRLNQSNLDDNEHKGKVSKAAQKKIENAVAWLLYSAKPKKVFDKSTGKSFSFRLNFITLTLPATQVHSDTEITDKCLKNFLDVWRKNQKGLAYVWKAETQANGNLHFHLVSNQFLHYEKLRKWWNKSVELLGYVSSFELKHKHRNPNSVDVHSVKHVRKIVSYLGKYMCKNRAFSCIGELRVVNGELTEIVYGSDTYRLENAYKKKGKVVGHILGARIRPVNCRLWSCSQNLSKQKPFHADETDLDFYQVGSLVKACKFRVYHGEFSSVLYGDFSSVISKMKEN